MTVEDIIKQYLKSIGADGLCNSDYECGCGDDDFAPCDNNCMQCEPAKKTICVECERNTKCCYQAEYDADFCYHIFPSPPKEGE